MAGEVEDGSVSVPNINLDKFRQLVRNYVDKVNYGVVSLLNYPNHFTTLH